MNAPRPKPLGPVHLYPERPKALRKGDNVALALDPDRWGRVADVLPGDRYTVAWADGYGIHPRADLVSRFTTVTPRPKGARR
ncbi:MULTISPECIES: hypothetical protein [Bacteria]|uniref:hypothetical protein n=1 Tax=Bacteria TaxID=2 RepID=UPI003C7B13C4